jgi:hypothetical protein
MTQQLLSAALPRLLEERCKLAPLMCSCVCSRKSSLGMPRTYNPSVNSCGGRSATYYDVLLPSAEMPANRTFSF